MDTRELNLLKRSYNIKGDNPDLIEALSRAVRIAPSELSVLVTGENGTGKEVIGKIIHDFSNRKKKKYIAINCGALPQGTINSTLFGHVKGAFTDAIADRKGYFEECNDGTIFLDEVAELPLESQAMLLRVLETGKFFKQGSTIEQTTNVRIVAATNKNLQEEIRAGRFRLDLYYRLAQAQITIPPLRERGNDILLLFGFFATNFAHEHHYKDIQLSEEARQRLLAYRWPGNVRELKNISEQMVVLEDGTTITKETLEKYIPANELTTIPGQQAQHDYSHDREIIFALIQRLMTEIELLKQGTGTNLNYTPYESQELVPAHIITNPSQLRRIGVADTQYNSADENEPQKVEASEVNETPALNETLKDLNIREIQRKLEENRGNRKKTALQLGISERTLYRKIKQYNLAQQG